MGFPGGSVGEESACNAGDLGSIPGWGRSPGEGRGNPLQYSCLENPMDGGAWLAAVHRVAKSQTRLSNKEKKLQYHWILENCPWSVWKWLWCLLLWWTSKDFVVSTVTLSIKTSKTTDCFHAWDCGKWLLLRKRRKFPVVQWLRLCAPNARGPEFNPWSGN